MQKVNKEREDIKNDGYSKCLVVSEGYESCLLLTL